MLPASSFTNSTLPQTQRGPDSSASARPPSSLSPEAWVPIPPGEIHLPRPGPCPHKLSDLDPSVICCVTLDKHLSASVSSSSVKGRR